MPAHPVFCSHCGSAQTAGASTDFSGSFSLHCPVCFGITIGLGKGWTAQSPDAGLQIPLPSVVSYQEDEFTCSSCEASLNVEIVLRSNQEPCGRCSHLAYPIAQIASASSLTSEEMAFLSAVEPSPA